MPFKKPQNNISPWNAAINHPKFTAKEFIANHPIEKTSEADKVTIRDLILKKVHTMINVREKMSIDPKESFRIFDKETKSPRLKRKIEIEQEAIMSLLDLAIQYESDEANELKQKLTEHAALALK